MQRIELRGILLIVDTERDIPMSQQKSSNSNPDCAGDQALMENLVHSGRDHLEPLIRRHGGALLGYLTRTTNDRHLAEEIFQETFLKVWEKRRTFNPLLPFRPWLFKIAVNELRQEFRRQSRRGKVVNSEIAGEQASQSPTPEDAAIQSESNKEAVAAARQLPERQRAVLSLRIWSGFSYQEIATILDCAEVTARANMHRALQSLRNKLGALENERTTDQRR